MTAPSADPPPAGPGYAGPQWPAGYPGHPAQPPFPPYGYGYAPPPPTVSPGGQPLADFGERLLAYLLDAVVFGLVMAVITLPPAIYIVFVVWAPELAEMDSTDGAQPDFATFFLPFLLLELGILVVGLLLAYVYYVEVMFRSGQTLGKRVMKLRVVPLDPAAKLSRSMAAKRYLAQHVAGIFVPFFSYLDGFWQLWDKPYRQCLHDKFADTTVVKVAQR